MGYSIRFLNGEEFLTNRAAVVDVYRRAFGEPPYNRTETDNIAFSESLHRHVSRPGFRSVVAVHAETGVIVGMAYGYTSLPGQWWYDVVTHGQSREFVREWIHGSFELVELAVKPEHQGYKLGSQLHDCLLSGLQYSKAVLSTMQADTVAYRLYLRRGWVTILPDFSFPGVSRVYQIMGLDLSRKQAS